MQTNATNLECTSSHIDESIISGCTCLKWIVFCEILDMAWLDRLYILPLLGQ